MPLFGLSCEGLTQGFLQFIGGQEKSVNFCLVVATPHKEVVTFPEHFFRDFWVEIS